MELSAIILLLLLLIALAWIVFTGRNQRLRRMFLAGRLKLRFSVQDTVGLTEQLAGLYLMQIGHAGRIYNLIHGRRGSLTVFACDYRFETGAGTDRRARRFTLVGCYQPPDPGVYLPSLVARREGEILPLGVFQNYQRLPNAGEKVYTDNLELGAALLEKLGKLPKLDWEFCMGNLVFYSEVELPPTRIARLLTRCRRCRRMIS